MSTAAELRKRGAGTRVARGRGKPRTGKLRKREAAATARDLLEAARLRFARQGFNQTRLADIAADVGVDPALLIRYFRSKEALFVAACTGDELEKLSADDLAQKLLEWILSSGPAGRESGFLILIRSLDHAPALEMLRERLTQLSNRLTAVVEPQDRELRADLVAALLLGIAMARRLLELPPLKEATVGSLAPYLVPMIALLSRANDTPPQTS